MFIFGDACIARSWPYAALDIGVDEGIFAEDSPIEEPPQEAQDRLEKLINDNEDCKDSDFDFEGE